VLKIGQMPYEVTSTFPVHWLTSSPSACCTNREKGWQVSTVQLQQGEEEQEMAQGQS